ncbi:GMC family oxidoreductase N-terminal domain-containing protein [Candidatus Leptofilum sp.]|uniref:GMC family oxidoreductase N-terminal domain-containing protein n=1 Tax=Candidatus Leptofilum sp. TaxID=3241576 RepID=UPI003B5CCB86
MRLSSPKSELKEQYQIVVIGSGYGGSIAASRLARAGQEVCVLERGRELWPGEYPDNELALAKETQLNTPLGHVGTKTALNEYHVNDEMTVLVGCGLGGTSLINGNVSLRTDPRIFEHPDWPQPFRDDVPTLLKNGYDLAEKMLGTATYPESLPPTPKFTAMKKAAKGLGANFYPAPMTVTFQDGPNVVGIDQKACKLCGDCMTGCNYHAKNSTLMNYLPDAKNHGATIFVEMEVRHLTKQDGLWQVHCTDLGDSSERSIQAEMVILAAGTLGTTKILFRSREAGLDLSQKLGHHFSGNGDVGGFAYNSDVSVYAIGTGPKVDKMPPVGPLINGVIDTRPQAENWEDGMVIEEGTLPSATKLGLVKGLKIMARATGEDSDSGWLDALREKFRELVSMIRGPYHGAVKHTLTWLVMTHDDSRGRLLLENDRIRIEWPDIGEQPFAQRVNDFLRRGTAVLGGTFVSNPLWSLLKSQPMVTSHPLGGCPMGEDAWQGVVNHKGQVFAGERGTAIHEGLYICDGSVIPHSIGVNLLLTISAMTERAMVLLAQDHGWQIDYSLPNQQS